MILLSMRFTLVLPCLVFLLIVCYIDAFGLSSKSCVQLKANNVFTARLSRRTSSRKAMTMDMSDLEAKLISAPEPAKEAYKQNKSKPSPKPVKEKPVKPVKAKTPVKSERSLLKEELALSKPVTTEPVKEKPAPSRPVTPEPVKEKPAPPKPVKEKPAPPKPVEAKVEPKKKEPVKDKPKKVKPEKKVEPKKTVPVSNKSNNRIASRLPKPFAPPKMTISEGESLAGVGLGLAPLVAVPVIGLTVLRGALGKTIARREAIQKEIEAAEKARIQKQLSSSTDESTAVKALASLGAAAATAALIVIAPFSGMNEFKPPELPKINVGTSTAKKPKVETTTVKSKISQFGFIKPQAKKA